MRFSALRNGVGNLQNIHDSCVAVPRIEADPEFLSKLYYGNGGLPDGKTTPESHKLDAYDQAMTARASYQEE